MILQRTAEFFHAASALSCRSGLDNDMRLKCRDGSEGGRHHHRLTSYDQPVRLDIIGITCRHPRPTGSSPCVDSSESCSTAQAARIYWDPPIRRYDADAWRPHSVSVTECGHQADFNGSEAPGPSGCAQPMDGAAGGEVSIL